MKECTDAASGFMNRFNVVKLLGECGAYKEKGVPIRGLFLIGSSRIRENIWLKLWNMRSVFFRAKSICSYLNFPPSGLYDTGEEFLTEVLGDSIGPILDSYAKAGVSEDYTFMHYFNVCFPRKIQDKYGNIKDKEPYDSIVVRKPAIPVYREPKEDAAIPDTILKQGMERRALGQESVGGQVWIKIKAKEHGRTVFVRKEDVEYHNKASWVFLDNNDNMMTELKNVLGVREKENLYVDFTGGRRSDALALVFICRILKARNVETKKVMYSNISNGAGTIEDCTGTYNLFLKIEGNDLEYLKTIKGINSKEIEELSKSIKEKELAETNNNAESYKRSLQKQQKQAGKLVKIKNSLVDETIRALQGNQPETSEQENSELLLLKTNLKKKDYARALNNFRQTYVSKILPRENIIVVKTGLTEEDLSAEVLAAYRYYENYSNKGEMQSCFLWEIRKYVKWLGDPQNGRKSPKDIADRKFNERFYNLEKRKDKLWIKNFGVNDTASWDIVCREVKPYINKWFDNTGDMEECLTLFERLFRLYTITGYPFECVYKNKVFPGYAKMYEGIRKQGIDVLEALYNEGHSEGVDNLFAALGIKPCTYRELIGELNKAGNEWMLTKIFPFSFRPDYIGPGSALTQDWGTFSYQLAKSFSMANRVRNQLTHKGSEVKNSEMYRAVEEVKKFVQLLAY